MMFWEHDVGLAIAAFLAASWAFWEVIRWLNRIQKRAFRMRLAATMLETFFDSADRFVDDPAAPERMVRMLDLMSKLSCERALAEAYLRFVKERFDGKNGDSDREPLAFKELKLLQKSRPDLVSEFTMALNAGITAMALRFEELEFEELTMLQLDAKQEVSAMQRAIKWWEENQGSNGPRNPLTA